MAIIRHPLSGHKTLEEVSLYRAYADLAYSNLREDRYFEAIVVCCIGLDVLLNTMLDRLLLFSSSKLDSCQKEILQSMQDQKDPLTAGGIIRLLRMACVLPKRLLGGLERLNQERNKVIHPITGKRLKRDAITPPIAEKRDADKFYRLFCYVIDLAGGQSPRKAERRLLQYVKERNLWRKARTAPRS